MILKVFLKVICCVLIVGCSYADSAKDNNKDGLKHPPKNIIIMISDGCGFNQVNAASLYQFGQFGAQFYEDFPICCAMSTFMAWGSYDPNIAWASFDYVRSGYTDSAAAATAMSTGVKTYDGAIGVGLDRKPLMHIIERCEQLGKSTGVITSVEWSHATPAGFVAHNSSRDNYRQIAQEMIYDSAVDVIMGCGHPFYDSNGDPKSIANTFKYVGGQDTWNDLVAGLAGGDSDNDGSDDPWTLIQTRAEFQALADGPTPKRVCGTAQVYKTLQQERGGDDNAAPYVVPQNQAVPTLEEMTKAALNVLDDDPNGFFLMVEGGAVDWASHDNQSGRTIEEEIDFNKAVEAVLHWVQATSNWGQTLVIVTSDHETGYLTGPGSGQTPDGPVWNPIINNESENLPGMEWHSDNHTNSLVPFYAKGRGANLFKSAAVDTDPVRGPYIDNTDIAKILLEQLKSSKEIYLPASSAQLTN
jgi:alkaline phosphatase